MAYFYIACFIFTPSFALEIIAAMKNLDFQFSSAQRKNFISERSRQDDCENDITYFIFTQLFLEKELCYFHIESQPGFVFIYMVYILLAKAIQISLVLRRKLACHSVYQSILMLQCYLTTIC